MIRFSCWNEKKYNIAMSWIEIVYQKEMCVIFIFNLVIKNGLELRI